jgi:hypothetical protein
VETQSPKTRRQAQLLSAATAPSTKPISLIANSVSEMPPPTEASNEESVSEGMVEKNLLNFDASCSITVTSDKSGSPTIPSSPLTDMDVDSDKLQEGSRGESPTVSECRSGEGSNVEVEMEDAESSSTGAVEVEQLFADDADVAHASGTSPVKPIKFYASLSEKAQGKQKEARVSEAPYLASRQEDEEEEAASSLNSVAT